MNEISKEGDIVGPGSEDSEELEIGQHVGDFDEVFDRQAAAKRLAELGIGTILDNSAADQQDGRTDEAEPDDNSTVINVDFGRNP